MYFTQASYAATCSFAAASATAAVRLWNRFRAASLPSLSVGGRRRPRLAARWLGHARHRPELACVAMSSRVARCSADNALRPPAVRGRRRGAVLVVALLAGLPGCSSWCSAPSEPSMGNARAEEGTRPHGRISSRPRGSRSFASSSAPQRDRASVAIGLRAEVLPAGPARYQMTPKTHALSLDIAHDSMKNETRNRCLVRAMTLAPSSGQVRAARVI